MDELLKDLEATNDDYVNVLNCDQYQNVEGPDYLSYTAVSLAALGYRKVVTCGECVYLEERVLSQTTNGGLEKMYICKSPHSHMKGIGRFNKDFYCSAGERVVAKIATTAPEQV